MSIESLTKEGMTSAKALVNLNIEISEARNVLFKLQSEETSFIENREKKTFKAIQALVETSKDLIKEAELHHGEIKELFIETTQFLQRVQEVYTALQELRVTVTSSMNLFETNVSEHEGQVADIQKQFLAERASITSDKKFVIREKNKLQQEWRKIEDEKSTISRTIERLKNNRI